MNYSIFPLHEVNRIENRITTGIPTGQRIFTRNTHGDGFPDLVVNYAREFMDDFTCLEYQYVDCSNWMRDFTFEEVKKGYKSREGFSLYRTDGELGVRSDCRRLLFPEKHSIAKTGFRNNNFGREGEVHLYGNPFGVSQASPVKKDYDVGRLPFNRDVNFTDSNWHLSHLCHNNWCYNWRHHVFEHTETNKARNGCPGGIYCHHIIQCPRPGPYSAL